MTTNDISKWARNAKQALLVDRDDDVIEVVPVDEVDCESGEFDDDCERYVGEDDDDEYVDDDDEDEYVKIDYDEVEALYDDHYEYAW